MRTVPPEAPCCHSQHGGITRQQLADDFQVSGDIIRMRRVHECLREQFPARIAEQFAEVAVHRGPVSVKVNVRHAENRLPSSGAQAPRHSGTRRRRRLAS